jgi:uncharacterized protein YcbK (DUF882 family)
MQNSTKRWPRNIRSVVVRGIGIRNRSGSNRIKCWVRLFDQSDGIFSQVRKDWSAALRRVSCKFCLSLILFLPLATLGHPTESATPSAREYRLRFYHTHTKERLDVVYRRGDQYIPAALDELDHFLRDHRTGDVHHYNPHLFDLLYDLTASLGDSGGEIDVICGYRTPWSNEFLRTRSPHTGVAQHSLHMQAEAIDIRLPGIPTSQLRDAAMRLHRGGVGYYRSSDFVHVDVGRVRHW